MYRYVFRSIVALALVGCGPGTRSLALGPPASARPDDCELRYEHLEPGEAATSLRQVGVVCIETPKSVEAIYQPRAWEHPYLQQAACRLGGQVVSPIGLCQIGHRGGIELGVYRDRPQ